MSPHDAIRLSGLLAATGHGWTDVHVEVYAAELATLEDADAAETVVRRLIRTWEKPVRIPIGVIVTEYGREIDRRSTPARALERGRVVPVSQGLQLAWRAYAAEARANGREPDRARFGAFAENISSEC